jgi:hypothetical protein
MSPVDRALRTLERVDHLMSRSPVILRKTSLRRERNAFELGLDAGAVGVRSKPVAPQRRKRHLHVV